MRSRATVRSHEHVSTTAARHHRKSVRQRRQSERLGAHSSLGLEICPLVLEKLVNARSLGILIWAWKNKCQFLLCCAQYSIKKSALKRRTRDFKIVFLKRSLIRFSCDLHDISRTVLALHWRSPPPPPSAVTNFYIIIMSGVGGVSYFAFVALLLFLQ